MLIKKRPWTDSYVGWNICSCTKDDARPRKSRVACAPEPYRLTRTGVNLADMLRMLKSRKEFTDLISFLSCSKSRILGMKPSWKKDVVKVLTPSIISSEGGKPSQLCACAGDGASSRAIDGDKIFMSPLIDVIGLVA
jgi:hypothetical protein